VQVRRVDGHTVLFIPGVYLAGRALPGLFRFDLDTGREKLAVAGNETARGWLVDANGVIAAEKDYDERGQRWAIRIHRDRGLADVSSGQEPIESPELLGFGMQPDTLLVSSLELGDPVWRLLSMKDGTLGPPMVERKLFDAPIEERLTSRLIGGVHRADDAKYTFFDADKEARWQRIARTFPGERVRFISATDDYSRFVVLVEGPRHGYQYELVDIDQNTVGPLNDVYPGIGAPYEVRAINYAAADGLQIPAYLTLPRGKPEKGLPLIVLPHGGPAVRDTAEFDWWSQALADQGYLVLRPNYRGSSLGWKFISAGFGQWGRKMQSDLSDGVRHLVHEGLVDPARVCIVGASYGGYAALAGVTLDPGVYRCAVSVAGIGDPARMLEREQDKVSFDKRAVRYWDRFMGATGAKDPALDAISPIRHIDAVTVPVLLIHGRDDTVVPYEQSEQMYKALHRAGKVVELVSLKHEDHWLSGSQTRLQMLEATVRFLRKYNPPE
jgi:dipeptidyl aminopeptidase/acylaminoacyl peptidase